MPNASAWRKFKATASSVSKRSQEAEVQLRRHRHLHVRRNGLRQDPHLKPSERGELEITDVNNAYIAEGTMTFNYLEGWWTDAGTFDSLLRAANLVHETEERKSQAALAGKAADEQLRSCK